MQQSSIIRKVIDPDRFLKQQYSSIEQRRLFLQQKKKQLANNFRNAYLIRIQPQYSYYKLNKNAKFISLIMQGTTKLSTINGHIHKRLQIQNGKSCIMYINNKIVDYNQIVSECKPQSDGIIYITYEELSTF